MINCTPYRGKSYFSKLRRTRRFESVIAVSERHYLKTLETVLSFACPPHLYRFRVSGSRSLLTCHRMMEAVHRMLDTSYLAEKPTRL